MKKLLFAVTLVISTCASATEWVPITLEAPNRTGYLADPTTIGESQDRLMMWHIVNQPQKKDGAMSAKILAAYDCKKNEVQILNGITYSLKNAGGQVVESLAPPTSKIQAKEGSAYGMLASFACSHASAAKARWEEVSDGSGKDKWLFEKGGLSRKGDLAYSTTLVNISAIEFEMHASMKTRRVQHCVERWIQVLETTIYAGLNGTGKVTLHKATPGTRVIAPVGSSGDSFISYACGERKKQ